MNIDDRLRAAFHARAETATTSPDAFEIIRERVRGGRRIRLLQIVAAGVTVPTIAVAAIALNAGDADRATPPRPDISGLATTEPTPAPTPTAEPTPARTTEPTPTTEPTSTPTATAVAPLSSYADAIAVAGARGYLGLHRPDGELIADVVTLEGRDIHRIVWTPDRTQLYVSSTATGSSDGCSKTVAIDLATKEVVALGNWSDVAFSSDGKKLAAFVEGDDCGVGSLLIRVVATRADTTVKSGERAEWDGLSSLNWVPGSDSVVFVQHGLGDSSAVRLLDPAKHDALDEAATLDPVTEGGGELVTSVTYAGNRMLIGTQCCLGATEYVRILERNRSTGRVTQLFRNDGNTLGIGSLEASPDGDQVIFSSFGDNASVWLWDMSGSSAPRTLVEGTAAAGW